MIPLEECQDGHLYFGLHRNGRLAVYWRGGFLYLSSDYPGDWDVGCDRHWSDGGTVRPYRDLGPIDNPIERILDALNVLMHPPPDKSLSCSSCDHVGLAGMEIIPEEDRVLCKECFREYVAKIRQRLAEERLAEEK